MDIFARPFHRYICVLAALLVAGCSDEQATAPARITAPQKVQFNLSPAFDTFVFLPYVYDTGGPNDAPSQSDLNAFSRADNVPGMLGVTWTWDDTDSWSGSGQTGDACALFDTNANGKANYAVCARITNAADGSVVQLPDGQSPQIYACSDKKSDRCSQPNPPPLPLQGTRCEITKTAEGFPGQGEDGEDVLAACAITLAAIGNASNTNLLNVCSFPSGAPNSNPFDCVVTPGAGFLQIVKKTTPDESGETFSWTLNPAATDGKTSFAVTDASPGDEQTGLIAVRPGNYTLTELALPAGWQLKTASCVRQDRGTGTRNGNTITNIGVTIGETTVCTFENIIGAPGVTVTKTANPTEILETGGSVTYSVEVTNTSTVAVKLDSLRDNRFGNLNAVGTCVTGASIAAGGKYTCSFTKELAPATAGSTHVNRITAWVSNAGGSASGFGDATVTYTDVPPAIGVTKTASPTSLPEPGGSVSYTVTVTNYVPEPVELKTLTDDLFGDLNGQGTCTTTNVIIAVGGNYSCVFSKNISGNAGDSHRNTVTATVADDDGTGASHSDDAVVTFTDVKPSITVTKTADRTSVAETGGDVTYTVEVYNGGVEEITLAALTDDRFGNLNGQGTCATGGKIAAGGTYSCSFTRSISGEPNAPHRNVITATVKDDENNSVPGTDDATVNFDDVKPDIALTKTVTPGTLGSTSGGGLGSFTPDRTFTSTQTPPAGQFQFATAVCDDGGPNDVQPQVDLNCFNRADNVNGKLGVEWTWDDINSWTGSGQTGDGCALLDTDDDGNANVAVCARITNTPDGLQILQVPGAGVADVYICNDAKSDRCAKQVTVVSNVRTTTCTVAIVGEAFPGLGEDGADVKATCSIDLAMEGLAGASSLDLLNVCSYPSGEPNSNPFDCVVKAGAGFIQIVKVVDLPGTQLFGFTLSPGSTDGTSRYAVQGGVSTALIPVTPGTSISLTETMPGGWKLQNASCTLNGDATGSFSAAANQVTRIKVETGQTTICTFTNSGMVSGDVTYTIKVKNNGLESVTLQSLIDPGFNLVSKGCTPTPVVLQGGNEYTCSFTTTLTGQPGTEFINRVTARAADNDGNVVEKEATATVTFVGGSP